MVRLVVTDLDGTFWCRGPIVPEAHVQAVHALVARGVTVMAATSRRPRVVREALLRAGLSLPAVLLDGALGIDFRSDERFHQTRFDPALAVSVLAAFRGLGLDPCICIDDAHSEIILSDNPATCTAHQRYIADAARVEDQDRAVIDYPVLAFTVLGRSKSLLGPVADLLSPTAEATLYAEPTYGEWGLIVNPPGVTKWSGVDAFCRIAQIDPSEVMAIGDGDNDVTMLKAAGSAVAVRGGSAKVLGVADHVINPPEEEGWAAVLDLVDGVSIDCR